MADLQRRLLAKLNITKHSTESFETRKALFGSIAVEDNFGRLHLSRCLRVEARHATFVLGVGNAR
jgi:hypothetical protein